MCNGGFSIILDPQVGDVTAAGERDREKGKVGHLADHFVDMSWQGHIKKITSIRLRSPFPLTSEVTMNVMDHLLHSQVKSQWMSRITLPTHISEVTMNVTDHSPHSQVKSQWMSRITFSTHKWSHNECKWSYNECHGSLSPLTSEVTMNVMDHPPHTQVKLQWMSRITFSTHKWSHNECHGSPSPFTSEITLNVMNQPLYLWVKSPWMSQIYLTNHKLNHPECHCSPSTTHKWSFTQPTHKWSHPECHGSTSLWMSWINFPKSVTPSITVILPVTEIFIPHSTRYLSENPKTDGKSACWCVCALGYICPGACASLSSC